MKTESSEGFILQRSAPGGLRDHTVSCIGLTPFLLLRRNPEALAHILPILTGFIPTAVKALDYFLVSWQEARSQSSWVLTHGCLHPFLWVPNIPTPNTTNQWEAWGSRVLGMCWFWLASVPLGIYDFQSWKIWIQNATDFASCLGLLGLNSWAVKFWDDFIPEYTEHSHTARR